MTAEEIRELETSTTLITDADKALYNQIMSAVAIEVSSSEPNRYILWRKGLSRRVRAKLLQDHFDISSSDLETIKISWEPSNTNS